MILIKADARHIPLRDEAVQTVVTSPPYWGLRDYGLGDKGIGLERTPEEYVANIVQVFREVWRVLRKDGLVWINLGDCYNANQGKGFDTHQDGGVRKALAASPRLKWGKPKDLVGIPWRVAFALQADGWYLRSDIIWAKPNPMPESVRDRPTKAHEYIFLLSKSQRYYYDQEATRERTGNEMSWDEYSRRTAPGATWPSGGITKYAGAHKHDGGHSHPNGRNLRSVWTIATQPFPGAHFATFPEALAERCIKAGTSERGACPKCGTGWKRISQNTEEYQNFVDAERKRKGNRSMRDGFPEAPGITRGTANKSVTKQTQTLGWSPSCSCDAGDPVPCVVLDPFGGSGTVARVAVKLGRRAVHLDLGYHELARTTRCTQIQQVMA